MKLVLGRGEVDEYSDNKLMRLKRKYPSLTFTTYLTLSNFGVSDTQIMRMYDVKRTSFWYFKSNHVKVLKEVRGW